jgi:beta-phosphoglucomutase
LIDGIQAVIFDMDGTLIEAKDWHYLALNEALAIFGEEISRDEHLGEFDGLPTKVKLSMLEKQNRLPAHLHPIVSAIKQERTLRYVGSQAFPRVEQLLMMSWLKARGFKLAVATNSIRGSAETMLSSVGLLSFLDVVVTNEDVRNAKPHPEMYILTATRLGLRPENCLVIEDHDYGVDAAVNAGCQVFKVDSVDQLDRTLLEELLRK